MIAACVATYGRPLLCPDALWCLRRQRIDVPAIIVICSEGYDQDCVMGWMVARSSRPLPMTLLAYKARFPTLGEKRNAMVHKAIELGATKIAVCDDDDLYTQDHLAHVHAGLQEHDVFYPKQHWVCREDRRWELDVVNTKPWTAHSGAGFRADAFLKAGGYPPENWSEDFRLWNAMVGNGASYGTVDHRPTFIRRVFDSSQHHTSRRKSLAPDSAGLPYESVGSMISDHAKEILNKAERSA